MPDVPIGEDAMPEIEAWFASHEPYGQTPLVTACEAVAANAASMFGPKGGAVVILSDGADTCKYANILDGPQQAALKNAALTAAAIDLYTNSNVKTYAIGYKYTGDPAQLNAIATNCGTDATAYIEAGDESALANALVDVLDDLKICLSP